MLDEQEDREELIKKTQLMTWFWLFLLSYFADQFDDVNNGIMMLKGENNLLEIFFEIGVLKHFVIFTGKQLCRDSNTGFFCEYCEFFINNFFAEHILWLLL